jgi:hypothetical protein
VKNKKNLFYLCLFTVALLLPLNSCLLVDDPEDESGNGGVTVTVSPSSVTLAKGTTQKFEATVTGSYSSSVTWSVEGNSSTTTAIDRDGLLTVAANESSRTWTVKATWSSYSDTASGTATVTVATDAEIPSNLKITKPEKTGLPLSWSAVTNASSYKVYRSINGEVYSPLGNTSAASYTDTTVVAGSSYYYAVSAVVNGLETGKSSVVFGFAEEYFALPALANRRLVPLTEKQKHYYRFPVTSGESYTLTLENGNSQDASSDIRMAAWQNNGTTIFTNAYSGYTAPRAFTAAATGYVTVEVNNVYGSTRLNYMAYFFGTSGEIDNGVSALPPAMVTGFKVTNPLASSITLGWDSVPEAVSYNIYRSSTSTAAPGKIGSSSSASYTDDLVSSGVNYYYTIAPVNAGGKEGVWVQGAFAYAADHFDLPTLSYARQMSLYPSSKHYYRLNVTAGQRITLTWQNESNHDPSSDLRVAAWQNNGTTIFSNAYNGNSAPREFAVTGAGFITVEVNNVYGSASRNYKIYYSYSN